MMISILPLNDRKSHEESTTCDCDPSIEFTEQGDMIVCHNSFDGREAIEIANEILN